MLRFHRRLILLSAYIQKTPQSQTHWAEDKWAIKYMNAYQKQVSEVFERQKTDCLPSEINDVLKDLLRKFKYYRLTMYTFSMASFIEVMLSGDFKEENMLLVKDEVEADALGRSWTNWTHLDANWYILGLKNDLLKPV